MTVTTNLTANLAAVHRFWQGFNSHNLEVWDEVCAPGFVHHDPGLSTPDADLATIKEIIMRLWFGAFPDLHSIEQELLVDGERVVMRRLLRGTHQGEFMGIAPTGKAVTAAGIWLSHLRNGKIKEQWVYVDTLGLLQQIGASLGQSK